MQKTAIGFREPVPCLPAISPGKYQPRLSRSMIKMLLVMKLTIVLLTAALVQVYAAGFAQTVTFSGRDVPLKEIFSVIREQTGYVAFYKQSTLDNTKPVSIRAKDMPLSAFLETILKEQPLEYYIEEKSIIISPLDHHPPSMPDLLTRQLITPVKGVILDAAGNPLVGATIKIKGKKNGTTTDQQGRFSIDVSEGDMLVITFVGLQETFIKIGKNGSGEGIQPGQVSQTGEGLVIRLAQAETALNEVTVSTGYWSTSAKLSTGNISKVTAKDIEKQPVTSLLMALVGRVPGLEITPTTGTPGNAPLIRVRGENSLRGRYNFMPGGTPLYIVDGVPVDARAILSGNSSLMNGGYDPLTTLDPNSIESIEVLKDADATAIYGSRGANGIIRITTKKGAFNQPTSLDIRTATGIANIQNRVAVLNTQQYVAMRKAAFANDGVTPNDNHVDINGVYDTTRYTDWQEELMGGSKNVTDIQLNVSGGSASTSFRFGGSLQKEGMIYDGDFGYNRKTTYLNLNHVSVDRRFIASLSVNYGVSKNKLFDDLNLIDKAITLQPNAPELYTEDGQLNWMPIRIMDLYTDARFDNPLALLRRTHKSTIDQMGFTGDMSYSVLTDLKLRATFGYTFTTHEELLKNPLSALPPFYNTTGSATFGDNKRRTWDISPQLVYEKGIGEHQLSVIIGASIQNGKYQGTRIYADGYSSDAMLESLIAAKRRTIAYELDGEYRYLAAFGRIGYNYADKYLLNLTARRDGSSRFGPGKRFGNFGAVGGAWIFSEERPFKGSKFFSFGKLRASYGVTGNDQIDDYQFYDTYSAGSYPYDGIVSVIPNGLFNPVLSWEQNLKLETGIDLGFFKDRFTLGLSWYRNRASNQLVRYPLPYTTGFDAIFSNFAALIQNTGVELLLNSRNIQTANFRWNSSFNISFNDNKLVAFDGIEDSPYDDQYQVGKSLSATRRYVYKGINRTTMKHEVYDITKDGTVNDDDRVFTDDIRREYYGGLNNSFQYKNFDLSFLFHFVKQRVQDPFNLVPGRNGNIPVYLYERWQRDGLKFTQKFQDAYQNQVLQSNYNVIDGSFIRLRTVSIMYTLPGKYANHIIKGASVYLQAQNLFTISDFPGLDPETGNGNPPMRIITAGLQFKF